MKYKNTKTIYNGQKYDSKKEAKRAYELTMLQRAGEISELQMQVVFPIEHNGIKICKYISDFTYKQNGQLVVEDTKSDYTKKLPVYRLKKKLLKSFYNLDIIET